jgi:hypothetical protein
MLILSSVYSLVKIFLFTNDSIEPKNLNSVKEIGLVLQQF